MTRWTAFSGIVVVLLGLLLALTRSSAALVGDGPSGRLDEPSEGTVDRGPDGPATADADGSPRMDDDSGGRVAALRDRLAGDEPTDPLSGSGGTERTTLSESDYPDPREHARSSPAEATGADTGDVGDTRGDVDTTAGTGDVGGTRGDVDTVADARDAVDPTTTGRRDTESADESASSDTDGREPAVPDDPTRTPPDGDPTRPTPADRTGPADRWRDPEDGRDRWTDDGGTPVDRWGDDDRDPEFSPDPTGEPEPDAAGGDTTSRGETVDERGRETGTRVESRESSPGISVEATPGSEATVSDAPFGGADPVVDGETEAFDPPIPAERDGVTVGSRRLSTRLLLLNVAGSQLLFAGLLVSAIVFAGVPAATLGLVPVATGLDLAVGVAAGVGLWVASESGGRLGQRFGIDPAEALRGALAPTTRGEWWLLLAGVLPVIALFEELLFRAVLVGAFAAGFAVPVWLLVVVSSVAFGLAHSAQGTAGMAVTGLLGAVLAGVFVLTGSFLAVVVAHYLVNALEFVVHEGPASRLSTE